MPVWGNRMVCETANYKHMEEKKKEFLERENSLGRWVKEKQERKQRLQRLNERIRQGSICSTMSQVETEREGNCQGSIDIDLDDDPFPSPSAPNPPTPPPAKNDVLDSYTRRNSAPSAPVHSTNSRPSSANVLRSVSLGSSFDEGDRARMVGEGRRYDHPCSQCVLQ